MISLLRAGGSSDEWVPTMRPSEEGLSRLADMSLAGSTSGACNIRDDAGARWTEPGAVVGSTVGLRLRLYSRFIQFHTHTDHTEQAKTADARCADARL